MLSDNIVLPGYHNEFGVECQRDLDIDKMSGKVELSCGFPDNSLYIRKSMKVISDYKYRVGDHLFVMCRIKATPFVTPEPLPQVGNKLDIVKGDRRDYSESTFWIRDFEVLAKIYLLMSS